MSVWNAGVWSMSFIACNICEARAGWRVLVVLRSR